MWRGGGINRIGVFSASRPVGPTRSAPGARLCGWLRERRSADDRAERNLGECDGCLPRHGRSAFAAPPRTVLYISLGQLPVRSPLALTSSASGEKSFHLYCYPLYCGYKVVHANVSFRTGSISHKRGATSLRDTHLTVLLGPFSSSHGARLHVERCRG